jgi:3-deoxy-7-phosphoheptulonate synthase
VILVLEPGLTQDQMDALKARLRDLGQEPRTERTGGVECLVVAGEGDAAQRASLKALEGVREVLSSLDGYWLASRRCRAEDTAVRAGRWSVGGPAFVLAAGPCAVENREQMEACAAAVKAAGGSILRGGSFKPRTSPYAFQGLGKEGLALHREAADRHGLAMMSEVLDREDLPLVAEFADILQVGSRNMQNFPLLKALGRQGKPVLLKRGLAATREEFLLAAEYVLKEGNPNVILCERGIRSFDPSLRNSLDLASVVLLKSMTHLPILVDPSHATGERSLVRPLARAAAAVGADGVLVEIHPAPREALSDGPQALLPEELRGLAEDLAAIGAVAGKTFGSPA